MSKKISASFVIVSLIYLTKLSIVNAGFSRFQKNPVLKPEKIYELSGVYAPTVVYKDGTYYMLYSSFGSSGMTLSFASSTDGVTWIKGPNPVLVPDSSNPFICEKNLHDPEVIFDHEENLFKLWYTVNCEPQSTGIPRYWIKYAYSSDGLVWTVNEAPVLSPTEHWEREAVANPTVLKEYGIYKMWYAARDSKGAWNIGYAESTDGINWIKHLSNPILKPTEWWELTHIASPDVLKLPNNKYRLFYYGAPIFPPHHIVYADSSDGLSWVKPTDNPILSVNSSEIYVSAPDILKDSTSLKLYYSAFINDKWHISLAMEKAPQPPKKIIFLPGLFGSWNKEAILHNQTVGLLDWSLNPIVKEYDGFIQTLKNLGYVENEDFFIFPFDWRKKLDDLADDLNDFISQKITDPGVKVNLVGHSLGGLVGRIFAQKYGTDKIDQLLTVGSPHQGAAQTYKTVEAGEIDEVNTIQKLAEKLILILNKDNFETDRETIEEKFPVAKDLLPTYDFLKKQNNQFIPISQMKIKNEILLSYNPTFSSLFSLFRAHVGEKGDTPFGYKIRSRTILDKLLGNYPDGRPKEILYDFGDYTVLSTSAKADSDFKTLSADHGEIIYKKESIEEILDSLGLPYQESQIEEGAATQILPSLIFLLLSAAEMEVEFNGQTYPKQDGLIFIENAPSGDYGLQVKGKEQGRYSIIIGQLTEKKDIWTKIEGKIIEDPPDSQTDTYTITFDVDNPLDFPVNQNDIGLLFDLLLDELTYINEDVNNGNLNKSIDELKKAKQNYLKSRLQLTKARLLSVHRKIFAARRNLDNAINKKIIHSLEKLENLYHRSLENLSLDPPRNILKRELFAIKRSVPGIERFLLFQQWRGRDVAGKAARILLINQKIDQIEKALNQDNLYLAQILLLSSNRLLIEATH